MLPGKAFFDLVEDIHGNVFRRTGPPGEKGYVVDILVVQCLNDVPEITLDDLEIHEHAVISEAVAGEKGLDSEIVAVELLAFTLVTDEAMCGRERIFNT